MMAYVFVFVLFLATIAYTCLNQNPHNPFHQQSSFPGFKGFYSNVQWV